MVAATRMTASHPLFPRYDYLQTLLCMLANPDMVLGVDRDDLDDPLVGRVQRAEARVWIEEEMQQILEAIVNGDEAVIADYAVERPLDEHVRDLVGQFVNADGDLIDVEAALIHVPHDGIEILPEVDEPFLAALTADILW